MEIKCPYCGSEDYEMYDDNYGEDKESIKGYCTCIDCDKDFTIIYTIHSIVKED